MRLSLRVLWFTLAIGLVPCSRVEAQPAAPKPSGEGGAWEVEVHGGGLIAATPDSGSIAMPPTGAPVPPNFYRPVSSWYFGDGSTQLNQFPSVRQSGMLTPLDATLQSRIATRESGGAFGVRLSRRIWGPLAAELSLDYGSSPLALTSEGRSAIDATRASFITALNGLFTGFFIASRTVNSTLTMSDEDGSQVITTGALRVALPGTRRWAPYAVAGAGGLAAGGDGPQAVLTGTYQVVISVPGSPAPSSTMSQTDTVTVTSTVDSGAVWMLGGGVRFAMSDRWGIRFDVRDHMQSNTLTTRVTASPMGPLAPFGVYTTTVFPNPPLVFSGPTFSSGSTLSVPLNDFVTFSGTGVVHHVGISTGFSWRF